MRAPRDILKHVTVEVAKAKRRCGRDRKHAITKGEVCVVVQEANFGSPKNYCQICAPAILAAARAKLDSLYSALGTTDSP